SLASGWVDLSPYIESQTASARSMADEAAKGLMSKGLKASAEVICGSPRSVILGFAEKWSPDLILIGSHGLSGVARFLLGSVAKSVLQGAHCPVEIVRGPGAAPQSGLKILLATDGSVCSRRAAKSIAKRPWPRGTEVKVLAVAEPVSATPYSWYAGVQVVDRLQAELRKGAEEDVEWAAGILSTAGLTAMKKVVLGNPKASIVDEAKKWESDLVVVGSHGRQGLDRFLIGSVAEAVALHSHCSVEVIKDKSH
ncbi:MAG TPA: universal stress protein, partial [Blastocatellia bacterium]|nr:universal stress protein [Blastocatellia bacterium]